MMLHGHANVVVEEADGDHWLAQECLRHVCGVRTDTEYLEWQELMLQAFAAAQVVDGRVGHARGGTAAGGCNGEA